MNRMLNYLFDPLCGWCYGAGGALPKIVRETGVTLQLFPIGLFSGAGARIMDEQFADYAWSNDQRISRLTGQKFSEKYRNQVLASRHQRFDSGPATVALTAVNLTDPAREYDALRTFQVARYIDGLDITNPEILGNILTENGLSEASKLLKSGNSSLQASTTARVTAGQALLNATGARGVPTFILEDTSGSRILDANAIFSSPENFTRELIAESK